MKDHPLFPSKPEADVVSIHVLRFDNGRKSYAAQKFAAEEMTEIGHVYARFGGGQYELEARGPTGKGNHGIVAREAIQIDGTSRPLNPEPPAPPQAAPVQAAPVAPPAQSSDLISIMMREAGEDRRAMMGLMVKMMDRPAPVAASGDSGLATVLSAMIAEQGATTRAILQGQGSGGGGGEKDPIGRVLEVMKVVTDLKEGMAEGLAERGKTGELDLATMGDGLQKLIGVVKEAKTLVDSGAGPEAAAEAAAKAAE